MNIIEIYKRYPAQQDCLNYLEKVIWKDKPICPYCKSKKATAMKSEKRYHCNNCNTSYRVTVGTMFHDSKIDLQKWFLAIRLVLNTETRISSRQLARDIEVNKNTARYMITRIRNTMIHDFEMLKEILEQDGADIGGNSKHKVNAKELIKVTIEGG